MDLLAEDQQFLDRKGFRYTLAMEGNFLALTIHTFPIPPGYCVAASDLLILLPGGFPEAVPDMWWFDPPVMFPNGSNPPQADVRQTMIGRQWQRFSRHFGNDDWRPGRSGVESYATLITKNLRGTT
jgi:Prokaryotic E2 family E